MKKLLISSLLCFSFLYLNNQADNSKSIDLSFSEERMITYAKSIGVKYIDVMVAQSRIETGWYSSKVFICNKNLFGLKIPQKRSTTAIGEKNNHAYYNKWEDSVMDYYLFCEYIISKRDIKSKNEWIKYIGKNYAEDIYYEKKIKKLLFLWINKLNVNDRCL